MTPELAPHQITTLNFFRPLSFFADFSEPGTGKTAVQIKLIEKHLTNHKPFRVLVFCPKPILHVWEDEIKKFSDLKYTIIKGTTKTKLRLLEEGLQKNAVIYVANYEAAIQIFCANTLPPGKARTRYYPTAIFQRLAPKWIILDESTKIKNFRAKRTQALITLSRSVSWRSILTGTPIPNHLLEIFTQACFLSSDLFGDNFWAFRSTYFHPGRKLGDKIIEWLPNKDAMTNIMQRLSKCSIRHLARNCISLPEISYQNVRVDLSKILREKFDVMAETYLCQVQNKQILASNALVKANKLRQIANGFIFDQEIREGENALPKIISIAEVLHAEHPKLLALDSLLEEIVGAGHKALVWSEWRPEIDSVTARYKYIYGAEKLYGGSPVNEIVNKFLEDEDCKVLICQPQTLSHGQNKLVAANYSIWLSLPWSNELYEQGNKRIERRGQTKRMMVYNIIANKTLDEIIIANLCERREVSFEALTNFLVKLKE